MNNLKKIFAILSKNEKKSAFLLFILILFSAVLEVLGIASILPVMALLSNPSLIESNKLINNFYIFFNFNDSQIFLFYTAVFFFIFYLVTMIVKGFATYLQIKFTMMCEFSIGQRLLQNYLHQPYSWFLERHSSDLTKNILSGVNQAVNQGLIPGFNLLSRGISALLIILLLAIVDIKLILIVGLVLVGIYVIIFKFFTKILSKIGQERVINDKGRYVTLSNSFGIIKETKLRSLENFFVNTFSNSAKKFAKNQSGAYMIGFLPRYFFEVIGFGGLLMMILYMMKNNNNFNSAIPILSLYAFAAYRLLPSLQQIYSAIVSLRYSGAAINLLSQDTELKFDNKNTSIKEKINFNQNILLKNVSFHYPNSNKYNLKNISIKIPVKSTVGIVGASGSGKSTLVDVILGLLKPHLGSIEIDNKTLNNNNLSSWQNIIGYVPQQIFLTNESILSNIAFGIESKSIDYTAIENASKIANLHDFITKELKEKYNTMIGEKGVRLSGGQRQRIGIARALYHNPKVLILDEATNALDGLNEKEIIDTLYKLNNKITIIIIAHRLNTIKECDQILLMDNGELIANGNYKDLSKFDHKFKKFII